MDSEEVSCGICLFPINSRDNPRGIINSCDHQFCLFCIREWGKQTNVCPICKLRFTRIYENSESSTSKKSVIKVIRRNYRGWEDLDETSSEEEVAEELPSSLLTEGSETSTRGRNRKLSSKSSTQQLPPCLVCGECDPVVLLFLCDNRQCDQAAHSYCLGFSETISSFYCPSCMPQQKTEGISLSPFQSGSNESNSKLTVSLPFLHSSFSQVSYSFTSYFISLPSTSLVPPRKSSSSLDNTRSDVPYYLQPNSYTSVAKDKFLSRIEDSVYYNRVNKRPRSSASFSPLSSSKSISEDSSISLNDLEKKLMKSYTKEMIPVITRRRQIHNAPSFRYIEDSASRYKTLPQPEIVPLISIEDEAKEEARILTQKRVGEIIKRNREAMERALNREKRREVVALAHLAALIRDRREKYLHAT